MKVNYTDIECRRAQGGADAWHRMADILTTIGALERNEIRGYIDQMISDAEAEADRQATEKDPIEFTDRTRGRQNALRALLPLLRLPQ